MPLTRHASWRRATKPARHEPSHFIDGAPPAQEENPTAQEVAEIERVLELMENGECAMGVDYPDGPMSPSGCLW